ncbi:MAG TPA: ABC transporter permease subunit [Verrucomicrobiae bacterium]|jgi:ABC-2 type transport system permease protein|nr:ABC transporter permease subunit [Verrucomicrobiae bacterium]
MIYYQLRNELWKMFGKKRTYIGFGAFLLAHATILLLVRYLQAPRRELVHRLELLGYSSDKFITNLTMALAVLIPVASLLMPLYVALVGGDLLAKEAEDGTLRMILARPISRFRLALVKWMAGLVFSFVLALTLGALGVAIASCLFPSGGLFAWLPMNNAGLELFSLFDPTEGWSRYAIATVILTADAATVMGLALMFSCFNVKPAAATILALSFWLTSKILQEMPYFHDLRQWFFTYHMDYWIKMFEQRVPWPEIIQSLSILFGFNLTLLIIGCVAFQVRDIKS